jgi:uncharacterized protein
MRSNKENGRSWAMNIIQAIDVHAHYGTCNNSAFKLVNELLSGGPERVLHFSKIANIRLSLVSPLKAIFPRRGGDPVSANQTSAEMIKETPGILYWAVVDPTKKETFEQAEDLLKTPYCIGIKIHPEEHDYKISEFGRKIFEFASKNSAVIQTHSGEKNSMPEDVTIFANEFPEVKIIVSHLGCGWDLDPSHQVRAIQKCRYDNMYTDTSSAKSIMPNLIEWAANEIGAERILFGTDSPLYYSPMQRARIDFAEINLIDKKKILFQNALKLFGGKVKNRYENLKLF